MNEISLGQYRHYKGKNNTVIGMVRHSETLEEHVVYRQEYGDHGLCVWQIARLRGRREAQRWQGTALEFCAGCGTRDPRIPPLAQATGVVTYNGEPLSGATISFASDLQDKGYHPGIGSTNDQGEFRIRTYNRDGAVVGSHKVSIVALDKDSCAVDPETGKERTMYDPRWKPPASLIPKKYGDHEKSTLTAEVESGVENQFSFELDDE